MLHPVKPVNCLLIAHNWLNFNDLSLIWRDFNVWFLSWKYNFHIILIIVRITEWNIGFGTWKFCSDTDKWYPDKWNPDKWIQNTKKKYGTWELLFGYWIFRITEFQINECWLYQQPYKSIYFLKGYDKINRLQCSI